MMSPDERIAFAEAAAPLMRYLRYNHNPHVKAIVGAYYAELVEGLANFIVEDYRDGVPVGKEDQHATTH